MTVVTSATAEDSQHQANAVTGEDDDRYDGISSGWSRQCSKSTSDDEESAHDLAPSVDRIENNTADTDEPHHEVTQGHRVGDAELVVQSFPAGTRTPPLEALQHGASPEVLSFDSTQPGGPIATDSAQARELTPDLQQDPEPEPESAGGKSLKRKASEELAGRKRKP